MNQEIKTKWVEALRSGRYEQGRGYLRSSENKYCCLGVLTDILNPNNWKQSEDSEYFIHTGQQGDNNFCFPSSYISNLADIGECIFELTNLNDFTGKDFNEIAQYIEDNL